MTAIGSLRLDESVHPILHRFGLHRADVFAVPSYSFYVVEVRKATSSAYLKRYPIEMTSRVRSCVHISETLRQGGLATPVFKRTTDGDCCAVEGAWVYTLASSVGRRSLRDMGAHPTEHITVPFLLVRVQRSLRAMSRFMPEPLRQPPAMWDSGGMDKRIDDVAEALRTQSDKFPFDVSTIVDFLRRLRPPSLHLIPTPRGPVHGDFWPGNLIEPTTNGALPGVIDFDNSYLGPLLLDVAQYVDLAYGVFDGSLKVGIDLARASRFARAWAYESDSRLEVLEHLPDVLVAARACSMLWILERHATEGPGPLDRLLENDRRAIEFMRQSKYHWVRMLTATRRRTIPQRRNGVA